MMERLPEALIVKGEIRCPICGRKHGELTGDEIILGFKMFCRGKDRYDNRHFFLINYNGRRDEGC